MKNNNRKIGWEKRRKNGFGTAWNKGIKGTNFSPGTQFKKGLIPWNKNKRWLENSGKNHWNWQGGRFKNKLWAKREKKVVLSANAEDRTSRFTQYNSFFIQKNKLFYAVDDDSSLLKTMEDKRDELKKYFRKNKIKFNKSVRSRTDSNSKRND